MKKILVLMSTLNGGGAVVSTAALVQGLKARGYDVTCAVLSLTDGVLPSDLRFIDFDVINLDVACRSKQLRRLMAFSKLKSLFKKTLADVVFCSDSPMLAWIACRALKSSGLREKTACYQIQRNTFSYALNNRFRGWTRNLVWSLFKRIYRAPDAVITISQGLKRDLLEYDLQEADKIKVVHDPIVRDFEALQAEQVEHPYLQELGSKIILGVGYLMRRKGFHILIEAFEKVVLEVPEARLIILGGRAPSEDDQEGLLRDLIEKLKLQDKVSLAGYKKNPFPYMKRADVFVLSSFEEGLPCVLIEAMACGVTPVSTDCLGGGADEALEGGRYGYLVPVADPSKMAAAVLEALKNPLSPSLLRQRASFFSVENSVEQCVPLIEAVPSCCKAL